MIVSGFRFSKETMMNNEELEDAFPKATLACAKRCKIVQYRIAGPCLINAYDEIAEKDQYCGHPKSAIAITRDKSLKVTKIYRALPSLTPPKLVTLPLSVNKSLQDKFNTPDKRMTVEHYGSKTPTATIGLEKGAPKTDGWSSEWFLNFG